MFGIEAILGWLRAGYPDGLAPNEYVPVVALLRRTLTDSEVDAVVEAMEHEGLHAAGERGAIKDAITQEAHTVPTTAETNAVAARLAAVGWPLAGVHPRSAPSKLQRILNWLRAGYPNGVPTTDYVPLFALLQRQLTHQEADAVALELIADARQRGKTPDETAARAAILRSTDALPSNEDVNRVAARLKQYGWPFDTDASH